MVGDARVPTEEQDLTAQRDALAALVVEPARVYVDHGFTGRNKNRAGLREALAACRDGDTFVVTKLDRMARSVSDAHEIAGDPASREIKLNIGGSIHDPTDPMGKLLANVLAMIAEFEADLISMRTHEGMKVAKANCQLRGKQPKLTARQEAHLLELHDAGEYTMTEMAELFSISRSTIYRAVERAQRRAAEPIRSRVLCSRLLTEPTQHEAKLGIGGAVRDPTHPDGQIHRSKPESA